MWICVFVPTVPPFAALSVWAWNNYAGVMNVMTLGNTLPAALCHMEFTISSHLFKIFIIPSCSSACVHLQSWKLANLLSSFSLSRRSYTWYFGNNLCCCCCCTVYCWIFVPCNGKKELKKRNRKRTALDNSAFFFCFKLFLT